jgi:hypothetical protein
MLNETGLDIEIIYYLFQSTKDMRVNNGEIQYDQKGKRTEDSTTQHSEMKPKKSVSFSSRQ